MSMIFKEENYIGKKFNRLTVTGHTFKNGKYYLVCQCDCGKIKEIIPYNVKSGATKSCGCLHREISKKKKDKPSYQTHGMTGTRIYKTWQGIKDRCNNPNMSNYKNYGGRGIELCKCLPNFETFYKWAMLHGYSDNLTIERKDVNGNYCVCKDNLKWATKSEQQRNKRLMPNNKTGHNGVYINNGRGKKYAASIVASGKPIYLGAYDTIEEAIVARKNGETKHWK